MHDHSTARRGLFPAVLALLLLANPQTSAAHPMGNFSINRYAGIRVEPGFIEVRYLIDMAEIPTYQEIQDAGIVPKEGDPSLAAYLEKKAELLGDGLALQINGQLLRLQLVSQSVIFPPGAGGLPTMKLGFVYRAAIETENLSPGSTCTVHYRDDNFTGRAGWKEVVVTAGPDAALTSSSVPAVDRSAQLSNYPTDLLHSPPQDLEARFSFLRPLATASITKSVNAIHQLQMHPATSEQHKTSSRDLRRHDRSQGGPENAAVVGPSGTKSPNAIGVASTPISLSLHANQQATPRGKFTELVSVRNLSFWFLFTAAFIAAGLGALHALEPGHGKTIVAAYLVGSKGTAGHAVLLGLIVTAAHTAGVYLLGAVTLYASKYFVPEQLYPWLGMISGIVIAIIASYMMIRAWTGEDGDSSHEIGGAHSHWFTSLGKGRSAENSDFQSLGDRGAPTGQASNNPNNKVSLTQLLTLGITGGIVPCPAALVVLLSAFSLHRVGFGFFLIVAFSLGLAAVLIAVGLSMVYAGNLIARWKSDGPILKRWLPIASAGFMLILGLGIAGRAFLTTGIGSSFLSQAKLPSFLGIVLLGLFLGMRHSTDPDHVVAVSTIASRERSVRQGALIGMLWGVGHTLTIFLVGSAIILFGLVIPPRIGLSMEFSVALMLIVLGLLNLTGVLRWLNERFDVRHSNTQEPASSRRPGNTVGGSLDRLMERYGSYQVFRPLTIGLVHGLAGSAAVALLVLSTIRSPLWAIAYLLVFGMGTVIGMILMTSAMAIPVAYTGNHFAVGGTYLSSISGIVSTGFGLFLVYQIGFVDGLFRANVHWTPK